MESPSSDIQARPEFDPFYGPSGHALPAEQNAHWEWNKSLLESDRDFAVLLIDPGSLLIDWNGAAKRIFGYDDSEILGWGISRLFTPDDGRSRVAEAWLAKAAAAGRADDERWLVRKNGMRFWASGVATATRDASGELQGFVYILRDMTDQKLSMEQVRENGVRFRQLLDATAEGIFGMDREGVCTFANTPCLELLGYEDIRELEGRNMHQLIHHTRPDGSPYPEEECPFRSALCGSRLEGEDVFWRRDGGPFPVQYHAYPLPRKGECAGAVITFLDITRQRQSETMRKAAEEKDRQARKMESIGRLAGGVAHEFNNALTAVNGFSELILDRLPSGDPLRSNLEEIRRGGERLAVLTQQLLSFGRGQVLLATSFDLNAFLAERLESIQNRLGEKIRFSAHLDPDSGRVRADLGRFEQMFFDLILKARDDMPEGGHIGIATGRLRIADDRESERLSLQPGVYARLSIHDTRETPAEKPQDTLFEPFPEAENLAKGPSGMALASAYGFIKQSGGNILMRYEPGQGTRLEIYFPLMEADETAFRPTIS